VQAMLMSSRKRLRRSMIAVHPGRRWVLSLTCCSLCAMTARALDLPDPYGPFGLSRGVLQPQRSYRSLDSVPNANEREFVEQRRLPVLYESTFWQRLADYKVHGGIRVLTLLDLKGSTLALQAGHGASPSLQWTSRTVHAGSAARGLLDHLFSVAPRRLEKPMPGREPEVAPRHGIGP